MEHIEHGRVLETEWSVIDFVGEQVFLHAKDGIWGGNWGTLRIPREDWGTLGKIREPPRPNGIVKVDLLKALRKWHQQTGSPGS